MEEPGASGSDFRSVTILDVLEVDICLRAILDLVHIRDIVRSERVSRRWQQAVLSYLQHCRSVTLWYRSNATGRYSRPWPHRTVMIKYSDDLQAIANKLGEATTSFRAKDIDNAALLIFALNCSHLEHVKIIDLRRRPKESQVENFSSKKLKKIETDPLWDHPDMTATFMRLMNNDLKSLTLIISSAPLDYTMFKQANCFWKLKSLKVKDFTGTMFKGLSSMLDRMPNLENIALTHGTTKDVLGEELIECFGRLLNLKNINLKNVTNNSLLETFSQSCKKLENLKITYRTEEGITFWRGLALLIKRQSPGITCLFFRYNIMYQSINRLNNELCLNGFGHVQVTRKMWETARTLAKQTSPYEVCFKLITHREAMEAKRQELKIILRKTYLGWQQHFVY